MNEKFFNPLRTDFIKYIQSYNFIPKVKFSIPLHEKSFFYIQGMKHLEKDIDDFQNKLKPEKRHGGI